MKKKILKSQIIMGFIIKFDEVPFLGTIDNTFTHANLFAQAKIIVRDIFQFNFLSLIVHRQEYKLNNKIDDS
jgi:hypothetical protein